MRLPFDERYSVKLEWTGQPTPQYVLRFCGDWLQAFSNQSDAITFARRDSDSRREVVRYHRRPTEAEIRFGHGATHYREFTVSYCYSHKTKKPKKRLKAKDDGLWYSLC